MTSTASTAPEPAARALPHVETPTPAALAGVAGALAAHIGLWERIAASEAGPFATRLAMGPGWEAWLQGWPPGHRSGLHDHGGSSGALAVVRGVLDETTLLTGHSPDAPARLKRRRLHVGGLRSFGGDHVHDLSNPGDEPAVSVHVIGPVPSAARGYELDGSGALLRTGTSPTPF